MMNWFVRFEKNMNTNIRRGTNLPERYQERKTRTDGGQEEFLSPDPSGRKSYKRDCTNGVSVSLFKSR